MAIKVLRLPSLINEQRGGGCYFVFESSAKAYGITAEPTTSFDIFTPIDIGDESPYIENIYVERVKYELYDFQLPEPDDETFYIVPSAIARQYIGTRHDLLFPLDEISSQATKENARYIPFYRTLAKIEQ